MLVRKYVQQRQLRLMHKALVILAISFLLGVNSQPKFELLASASIVCSMYQDDSIVVGTDAGTIETFDIESKLHSIEYTFDTIHDFMGDEVYPWVMSIDKLQDTYLVVSQGEKGARLTSQIHNGIISDIQFTSSLLINKAVYINKNEILIALLSNELILYDLIHQTIKFKIQINQSVFSDFVLNKDKTKVAVCDESGEINIVDIIKGSIVNKLTKGNLDRIFTLDWKENLIITAGQDRRAILYDITNNTRKIFRGSFLVYASGLSHDLEFGAYSSNEMNEISVFDTDSSDILFNLQGMKSALISIYFTNNQHVIGVGSNQSILIWELT